MRNRCAARARQDTIAHQQPLACRIFQTHGHIVVIAQCSQLFVPRRIIASQGQSAAAPMQCRLRMRGNSSVMQRCHGSAALRQQIRTTSHTYRCSVVDGRACTDRRAHSASWVGGAGAPVASEAGAIAESGATLGCTV